METKMIWRSCKLLKEIAINRDIKPVALVNEIFTISNTEFNDKQFQNLEIRQVAVRTPEARGSVVGRGTMLQAGRSRVWFPMRALDFSIDLILPAAI
jgi:hypothetical protein